MLCFYFLLVGLLCSTCTSFSMEMGEKYCFEIIKKAVQSSKNQNIFQSVSGLLESISILYAASDGETKRILEEIVQFSPVKDTHHHEFTTYKKKLIESNDDNTIFKQHSSLCHIDDISLSQRFKKTLQEFYQCDIISSASDRHRLIDQGGLDQSAPRHLLDSLLSGLSDTEILLITINSFKSGWNTPFDPTDTKERPFHNYNGTVSSVPFLVGNGRYQAVQSEDYTLLRLGYKNSRFFLLILLPNRDIDSFLQNFDWDKIKNEIPTKFSPVLVRIPKFKIQSYLDFKNYMAEGKMAKIFTSDLDLSEMTSTKKLNLNNIFQVAQFEVDETGTTASSAMFMSIGFRSLSIPKIVDVNRPFVFCIVNPDVAYPIYFGKVLSF